MLQAGKRLGRYQILGPLGQGGMGEVYRAKDLRLHREVAVKVIRDGFADDRNRLLRFEREARAVAALAHPNILVLYDVGEEECLPYAVTELLEGSTLRSRLASGALPWREALEIGAAVAEGLAAAHAKGIVHRDIKPENLFLTAEGRIKILDFGLARMVLPGTAGGESGTLISGQTAPGEVMGTLAYMSPEQLRGLSVDARSDLFSLGCVLFELVTARRPFQGRSVADTSAAILHNEPPQLASLAANVPADVEHILGLCLKKAADQRIQTARDLAFALRAVIDGRDAAAALATTDSFSPPRRRPKRDAIRSLAVLPLTNAQVDAETEYLGDGITERVIDALSQLPGLRVMARNTVFRYRGSDVDAQGAGRALKVRSVLIGRIVQRGNRVVIETELVDVSDGSRLWGQRYERELADLYALEQAIAHDIAEKLQLRLTSAQRKRLTEKSPRDPQAYQCYLKGRYHWNKRTKDGFLRSIKLFEQAIEFDPTYALAYAGISDAYHQLGGWSDLPFHEAYPRAKAAAQKALAIDEQLAEAHISLAMTLKEYEWDWQAAGREYERGLELNPNYPDAHHWYGEYLAAQGRHAEAIASIKRAGELDPLSLIIHATLGRHGYHFARRYDEAIAQLQKTLEMDDNFWVAHHWLGLTYTVVGRYDEAFTEIEAARRLSDNLEVPAIFGYALGRAGRTDEARATLKQLEQTSQSRYFSPMLGALVSIGIGDHEQAFRWLERGYQDRAQMLSELHAEAAFDPLRSDARFADLLQRVGLPADSPRR